MDKTRKLAFDVLMDIEKNGSYSNISLNKALNVSELDNRDRGLVTDIVYGVIENKIFLDYAIDRFSKIKTKKMNYAVRVVLRIGAYQILMSGTADYAALNESVKLIKKYNYKSSGFVNAILRNILKNREEILSFDEDMSIRYSFEKWILERLEKDYGKVEAEEIVKALCEKPRIYVRVNRLKSDKSVKTLRKDVSENLSKDGVKTCDVYGFEEALEVKGLKNIQANELFKRGYISVQDISSMVVGYSVNPKIGERIIDVCSAPGGKSTHIAEIMGDTGEIISRDIYEHKIDLINSYKNRLGIKSIKPELSDAREIDKRYIAKFDKVLCDAPCPGIGIVRRKPEIKYKKEEEIVDLPKIQLDILEKSSKYVKSGGEIIYSTCTLLKAENIEVVEKFLDRNKDFYLERINLPHAMEKYSFFDNKGVLEIIPNRDNMDGFFVAKMKKK